MSQVGDADAAALIDRQSRSPNAGMQVSTQTAGGSDATNAQTAREKKAVFHFEGQKPVNRVWSDFPGPRFVFGFEHGEWFLKRRLVAEAAANRQMPTHRPGCGNGGRAFLFLLANMEIAWL